MRKSKDSRLSLTSTLFFILALLSSFSTHSQPAQRFIIHFHQGLDNQQLNSIESELKHLIPISFEVRKNTNPSSWIIIFQQRLTAAQLKEINENLLNNALISNIEMDQLLEIKPASSTSH